MGTAKIMTGRDSYLLLRAFCDELARCGVREACTSPGSRSAPLVLSLARNPRIECWSVIDERSAGFFALGLAKQSGVPSVVTCTSGTAAAELLPAIVEANAARVPLIILTADRPPELREIGAGQSIDQLKLYSSAAKWFFEVGTHTASDERLAWIRTLACRAYDTASSGPMGVVHLNFPLREPLVVDPEPATAVEGDSRALRGRENAQPWVTRPRMRTRLGAEDTKRFEQQLEAAKRPLIIAGNGVATTPLATVLRDLAQRLSLPLLADPLSGARIGDAAVAHYDLMLRSQQVVADLEPDLVLRFGDLPTSKPLRAFLAKLSCEQVSFDADSTWQDPSGVVSERIAADPIELLYPLVASGKPSEAREQWLTSWRQRDELIAVTVDRLLGDQLSEPWVARHLGQRLSEKAELFVASSMPIRDVESFWPARSAMPSVRSNRGANGIDGTVSTALGVGARRGSGAVLLSGDVAFAYDLTALQLAQRHEQRLTAVVINNDGGGIFHFLPLANEPEHFEEHVATPHGIDLQRVSDLYGAVYQQPETQDQFEVALDFALHSENIDIIEVRTDRRANRDLHGKIADEVVAELGRAVSL